MEEIIAITVIFGFAAFVCTGIYKLIRAKMDRDHGIPAESFDRLARAFMQHKKEMEHRVQNLEAIIADDEKTSLPEIEEHRDNEKFSNNLRNKDRVRQ